MGFTIRGAIVLVIVLAAGTRGARADPATSGELRLAEVIAAAVRQSPDLERARIDLAAARAQLLAGGGHRGHPRRGGGDGGGEPQHAG